MYYEEEYFTYTNQQKLKAQQMDAIKANLDGTPVLEPVDMNSLYLIDFSKCTSVNDVMIILSSIGFTFSPHHPGFDTLRPFLALDKPIPMQNLQQSQAQKDLELPKLKSLK
jgi:hypothetical protein